MTATQRPVQRQSPGPALRAMQMLRAGAGTLGVLLVLGWGVGKLVSDRFLWSQFLAWVPALLVLLVSGALLLAAGWIIAWRAQPRGATHIRVLHVQLGVLVLVAPALWFVLHDLRAHTLLTRLWTPVQPAALSLVCWNATDAKVQTMARLASAHDADIVLLANTPFRASFVPVRDAIEASALRRGKPATSYAATTIRVSVLSRFPIVRWAALSLGVTGARERTFTWPGGSNTSVDVGEFIAVELDTTRELGTTTVVWLLDVPSDPDIPRKRMMREARASIDAMRTSIFDRSDHGMDAPITLAPSRDAALRRLLAPDIIAGDFNATRGSWSLSQLTGTGYVHAKDAAVRGAGLSATFPREHALLHIDHVFLRSAHLRALRYDTIDMGEGRHRAQVVALGAATLQP